MQTSAMKVRDLKAVIRRRAIQQYKREGLKEFFIYGERGLLLVLCTSVYRW